MSGKDLCRISSIEADLKSQMVCSNLNRVCMLHLLNKSPGNEMQAEEMAYRLGLSHRTVLYHLDVLHDHELVEVRKFRKRGNKLMRSVWGLNDKNGHLRRVLKDIGKEFDCSDLDKRIQRNSAHQ